MKKFIFIFLKEDFGGGNKVIYEISKKNNSKNLFLFGGKGFLKKLKEIKSDNQLIVIASDPIVCIILFFFRIKFIRFVQAVDLILFDKRLPEILNIFYKFLYKKSLQQKIIYNSEFVKKKLKSINSDLTFIGKVLPGTNFIYKDTKKIFDFIFILRKAPWKNSLFSLKVISFLQDNNVKIAIVDPDNFLKHHSISKNVKKYKYVDRFKLNKLFQQSCFYFSSTQHEGFGMPCLESMRSGCIPIAPNGCGHDEFMFNMKNSILYDMNTVNIIQFLDEISKISNDDLNKIKINGIKSSSLLSWESTCSNFNKAMEFI